MFFFFFSSRRRHTRYWRDWSSDVCSSDLSDSRLWNYQSRSHSSRQCAFRRQVFHSCLPRTPLLHHKSKRLLAREQRSEERRVGKSVDLDGCRIMNEKNKKE